MPLNLSIYLPKESIEDIESLQEFISDLGDTLVNHGFGNEILIDELDSNYLERVNSYIIIKTEENNPLENLGDSYLVIPVEDKF